MTTEERHQLYNVFQQTFPIEKLSEMTLEEYTNLNKSNSFCYWLESKTTELGSFWGGSSYKFGIYEYIKKPSDNDALVVCDDKYAWYKKLQCDTAIDAFKVVRDTIIQIAQAAANGQFGDIDSINTLGNSYKWKIAFLYSGLSLMPIYKRHLLTKAASIMGIPTKSTDTTSIIQKALIEKKGNIDVFEYTESIISKIAEEEAKETPHVWLYAPGEDAFLWDDCTKNGIMLIGWNRMGDLSELSSKDELDLAYDKAYPNGETSGTNSKLCLWEFYNRIKVGDIVYVKQGLTKIIGRGVVASDYIYDPTQETFHHIRKVDWTHIGNWDTQKHLKQKLPMKTLTDMSKYQEWVESAKKIIGIEQEINNSPQTASNTDIEGHWWLVANPKYWTFKDLKDNDTIEYTIRNSNGNLRHIASNFGQAKVGEIVIGYEATPTKSIVAIAVVEHASNGSTICFKKIETLSTPIAWSDFKDIEGLQNMEFIKNPNGSFFKLTQKEYDILRQIIGNENFHSDDDATSISQPIIPSFSKKDFLKDVFMNEDTFERLRSLLLLKKNIILQGAPGVGKTFCAKRLAYAVMGKRDDKRIKMVQFHQNYSYEDFIMGYKPTNNGGFQLQTGIFYDFCQKASDDPEHQYFFIIDEINRGNLSKIFGELLMLIENGYRDKPIQLAYRKEDFAVPSNLYIIGMMNTADRSLAMIDYALRRRFSFFTMRPGFDTDGFKSEIAKHSDARIDKVIDIIKQLNVDIAGDESLGEGFCIGHSYFCGHKEDSEWIENVVRYDICPMLEEYWFDNKNKRQASIDMLINAVKQ